METINIKLEEYPELKLIKDSSSYSNILQTIFRLGYNTYFNSISNKLVILKAFIF
jgi:hypothetical protein